MCVESPWSNWQAHVRGGRACETRAEWEAVDLSLRRMAKDRAALDAHEARYLREAERLQIWRHTGFATMLAYMESRLGYGPRTAIERLRVARELAKLPKLEAALGAGQLCHPAVRELTRVAVRENEEVWLAEARGKNLREIEELVRGRNKGSNPEDPAGPDIRPRPVSFEISPSTYALLRQVQTVLADEKGQRLDDDELIQTLCRAVLAGGAEGEQGRARHQVAITVCQRCERGWQDGAGAVVELAAVELEMAACDAQHIGSVHAEKPERAQQDIPPATRRLIWRRDHGRCQVGTCRSARNLDVHHVVFRDDGGTHHPSNLCLLCWGCHRAVHEGTILVTGEAPFLKFERREPIEAAEEPADVAEPTCARPEVAEPIPPVHTCAQEPRSKLELATLRTQVRDAVVRLGYAPGDVREALARAFEVAGPAAKLEDYLRETLRRCRRAS